MPELGGLSYDLYKSMPDSFGYLLVYVYTNWQWNELISRFVLRGCEQEKETFLHTIVHCSGVSEVWANAEHLLSCTRKAQLSSE